MAPPIIDLLEPVHVEQRKRADGAQRTLSLRCIQEALEEGSIADSGERVAFGLGSQELPPRMIRSDVLLHSVEHPGSPVGALRRRGDPYPSLMAAGTKDARIQREAGARLNRMRPLPLEQMPRLLAVHVHDGLAIRRPIVRQAKDAEDAPRPAKPIVRKIA